MVRAGGWQAVTGAKTVLRVYARRVIAEHLDMYSMSVGIERTEADWAKKREQYIGQPSFPPKPMVDLGRQQDNQQLRVMVWRSVAWQQHQRDLNLCFSRFFWGLWL